MDKDGLFKLIQKLMSDHPLIIWGSGATVPCGMPTMSQLSQAIKDITDLPIDVTKSLEAELCKPELTSEADKIRRIIFERILESDAKIIDLLRKRSCAYFDAVADLIKLIYEAHPKVVNFLTTNYDRVVEHVAAWNGYRVYDGTIQGNLGLFNVCEFKDHDAVNVIKVHGSLSWGDFDGATRNCFGKLPDEVDPVIIIPGNQKYQATHQNPYRALIQKADDTIQKASAFLAIGFGFNDEHITPFVNTKINDGTPIIVIALKISDNCRKMLARARTYVLLEANEADEGLTQVSYCDGVNMARGDMKIDGRYWKLDKFMEVFK